MDIGILMGKLQFLHYDLAKALLIIVIYALLAKFTDIVLDRFVLKLAKKTRWTFDDAILKVVHAPVCWTIFFLGVLHSLLWVRLGQPWDVIVPSAVRTLILVVWWIAVFRFVSWAVESSVSILERQGKIGHDIFFLFKNVIRVSVAAVGVLWMLSIWKVNLTPLFASAGIAGIAVALAAKDTLANFFGGISIFVDRSFKVGDYIILDSGERGEVVDIGIRSTKMKTRDDVLITVPNSILANAKIINESAPIPRFRIRVPVGVAYGSDLGKVEALLVRAAHDNPLVNNDPAPRARVRAFSESSIDFELLCWVADPGKKGLAMHRLFGAIYEVFEREGIVIPFPQRDVHLIQAFDQSSPKS